MTWSSSRDLNSYTVHFLKKGVKELIDEINPNQIHFEYMVEKTKEERLRLMDKLIECSKFASSPFTLELEEIKKDMKTLFLTKRRKDKIRKSLTSMLIVLIDIEYHIIRRSSTTESFKSKQEEKPDKVVSLENIDKALEKVKEYRNQGYKIKIKKTSYGKIKVIKCQQ